MGHREMVLKGQDRKKPSIASFSVISLATLNFT